jgi:hypothetical protein
MEQVMETANLHPAVQLMLARMDTHPEEFRPRGYRWEALVDTMLSAASPEETLALTTKLNRFRMDALHEQLMAELLDGTPVKPQGGAYAFTTYPVSPPTIQQAQNALMSYRNAADPPAGMGNALRSIFK